jgi:predicted kinase
MNSWYRFGTSEKILIICRGISGSGKSTLAKQLAGKTGIVLSTDEYFIDKGQYNFNPQKLSEAHTWNFERALKALDDGISPIVIDNTNIQAWEAQRYVKAAIENGYRVEIKEPDTDWKFNAEELAKRNTHGVPQKSIERMISRWEPDLTVDDILNAKNPYDEG